LTNSSKLPANAFFEVEKGSEDPVGRLKYVKNSEMSCGICITNVATKSRGEIL